LETGKKIIYELGEFFQIIPEIKVEKLPEEVKKLVEEREEARKKGDFKKADEIREKIKSLGYLIEDTKKGPKIKKI
jgi:cysteinyl-tRNA synthetase